MTFGFWEAVFLHECSTEPVTATPAAAAENELRLPAFTSQAPGQKEHRPEPYAAGYEILKETRAARTKELGLVPAGVRTPKRHQMLEDDIPL